jgi:hypothetical protein
VAQAGACTGCATHLPDLLPTELAGPRAIRCKRPHPGPTRPPIAARSFRRTPFCQPLDASRNAIGGATGGSRSHQLAEDFGVALAQLRQGHFTAFLDLFSDGAGCCGRHSSSGSCGPRHPELSGSGTVAFTRGQTKGDMLRNFKSRAAGTWMHDRDACGVGVRVDEPGRCNGQELDRSRGNARWVPAIV